jgi:hypothetical protein
MMKRPSSRAPLLPFPVMVALACGGEAPAPQSPPPVQAVTVQAQPVRPSPQATPSPALPTAVELPAALAAPARIACVYTGRPSTVTPLQGTATGDAFATLDASSTDVKVSLSIGSADAGFYIESDIGSAVLHGFARGTSVALYPQSATSLHGFLIPTELSLPTIMKSDIDSVNFTPSFDKAILSATSTDLSESRPCSFFGLRPSGFNPLKATGSEAQKKGGFKTGKHEIRAELNGPVVASITTDEKSPEAYVLATSGSHKRFAWPVGRDAYVFGWALAKDLVDLNLPVSDPPGVAGSLSGSARNEGVATWTRVKCKEDLPLVAELAGARQVVGTIKKEKFFQVGPDQKGWRGVAFPDSALRASDKGQLLVPSFKTVSCGP